MQVGCYFIKQCASMQIVYTTRTASRMLVCTVCSCAPESVFSGSILAHVQVCYASV